LPSPIRLALQISCSVYSTSAPKHLGCSIPSYCPTRFQIRIDHTSTILEQLGPCSVHFPSRPIDTGSRDFQVVMRLSKAPRPLASGSHLFPFVRFSAPPSSSPRSISRCLRQSPPRTRRRQATASACPASAPAPLYRTFTDPSSLRSLVPFSSAPRTPRGFARTTLGTTTTLAPPFARPRSFPRPNSHVHHPLAHPRSRREIEYHGLGEKCGAFSVRVWGVGQIGLRRDRSDSTRATAR